MHSPPPPPQALSKIWPSAPLLDTVEAAIGHHFADRHLLAAALLHRSAAAEAGAPDWAEAQRLEFLGDAVLGLLSADWLMAHAPRHTREGAMTKIRSRLTNTDAFADVARRAGLDHAVILGKGEDASGGRRRPALLADTLEAVFGAIWLDGAWPAVAHAFDFLFVHEREAALRAGTDVNPKGAVQELARQLWNISPTYELVSCDGPSHARTFGVLARLVLPATPPDAPSVLEARASAPSKQGAEIAAAAALLDAIRALEQKK
jgi:ribonuclease-3